MRRGDDRVAPSSRRRYDGGRAYSSPAPAECPSWYLLCAALVLGALATLLYTEVQFQNAVAQQALVAQGPKAQCPSTVEVTALLSKVGHLEYWPNMQRIGLDRLDIVAAAPQSDATEAGIKPYHWMRIVTEATVVLSGRRVDKVPENAIPLMEMMEDEVPATEPPKPTDAPATPAPKEKEKEAEVAPQKEVEVKTPPPTPVPPPKIVATPEPTGSTDVVLPPEDELLSAGVPAGKVLPAATAQTDKITVTCVADNGLGDRLGTLFDGIWLAYILDARFHVLWNMNNECRARMGVLFSFDGSHVSVPDNGTSGLEVALKGMTKDFDAIITLGHHRGTAHLVDPSVSTKVSPGYSHPWYSHTARPISLEPDSDLVMWAKARQKAGLRTHILHHSDRLASGVTLEGLKKAMAKYNFRLAGPLWERVQSFTKLHKITPKATVGVHLRATDARIPLMMDVVISDVRQRFPDRTFYVCSDQKDKEEQFMEAFPGKVVRNTFKTHYPTKLRGKEEEGWRLQGVLGSARFNVERGEHAVVDAMTDMAILSRTEKPVIKGVLRDSSFGKMATTLCIIGIACDEKLQAEAASAPGSSSSFLSAV